MRHPVRLPSYGLSRMFPNGLNFSKGYLTERQVNGLRREQTIPHVPRFKYSEKKQRLFCNGGGGLALRMRIRDGLGRSNVAEDVTQRDNEFLAVPLPEK